MTQHTTTFEIERPVSANDAVVSHPARRHGSSRDSS